ncbi:uncharacterized protein V6R79_012318 [Siganus canaliculatus]
MFQQAFQNFNINFNAVNGRTSFSSGDILTGHISFDLPKQTKITSIEMALRGRVHVHWSSGSGKSRRNYSAKVDFFKLKSSILQENSVTGGTRLQPGTHMYPFTCQIPQGDFPSTFHGVHGQITYTIIVSIYRPWHLAKEFVTELSFAHHMDINQPILRAPLSGINSMTLCSLWCTSGPITMKVTTEKKAFVPGETVKLFCDFGNGSSQIATPSVKLQQKQSFFTANKVSSRIVCKNMARVNGLPVSPHTSAVHTEIMLTIPSSAAPTISNCTLLQVEYLIKVKLGARGSADLEVHVPIVLCDAPVVPLPPQEL